VLVGSAEDCWPWTSTVSSRGYGVYSVNGRYVGCHRISYEVNIGQIPLGHVVGHRCHDLDLSCLGGILCPHRRCVNPLHLLIQTIGENVRSGVRGRQGLGLVDSIPVEGPLPRKDRDG